MPVKRTPVCKRVAGEGAPARADLEHRLAGAELAFLDGPVEFPLERLGQRLVVIGVDALAIGGKDGIEKAQEQLRVGIVVRGDRPLVGVDLPEQKRLDEAPSRDQRMTVVKCGASAKGFSMSPSMSMSPCR